MKRNVSKSSGAYLRADGISVTTKGGIDQACRQNLLFHHTRTYARSSSWCPLFYSCRHPRYHRSMMGALGVVVTSELTWDCEASVELATDKKDS